MIPVSVTTRAGILLHFEILIQSSPKRPGILNTESTAVAASYLQNSNFASVPTIELKFYLTSSGNIEHRMYSCYYVAST